MDASQTALKPSLEHIGFDPDARRAFALDSRMRERLGQSLRYIIEQVSGAIALPRAAMKGFLARLGRGPMPPGVFGAYYELVLAIEAGRLGDAALLLQEIAAIQEAPAGLAILDLADAGSDARADRYRRHINAGREELRVTLVAPGEAAAACRQRIQGAFALLDAGNAPLAEEIRALLREIVITAGAAHEDALNFTGGSSFTLWGATFLNARSGGTVLDMVQRLAHESGHNLLFGLSIDGPLDETDPDERFVSPLRDDPRPMDGLLHATFVSARMHQAIYRLREAGVLDPGQRGKAEAVLTSRAAAFAEGAREMDRHAHLTTRGHAVIEAARRYMAPHLAHL